MMRIAIVDEFVHGAISRKYETACIGQFSRLHYDINHDVIVNVHPKRNWKFKMLHLPVHNFITNTI